MIVAKCSQTLASNGKTVTRSFRISETALSAMQEESARRNVSVNTLLNQLLLSYAMYDRFLKRFQVVKLTSSSFKHLLEAADEDQIARAGAAAGKDAPRALISARAGEINLEKVIDFIRDTGDYTDMFEYSEIKVGGKTTITLSHSLGRKGSLYIERYLQSLLSSIDVSPRFSIANDSIVLHF